ncbi:MAG: hypothetical protein KF858_09185 [Candidatus Sumerlaeia bacterium]|nr:hypothetical protein [Candidatus Sumerlaeia bacterium]
MNPREQLLDTCRRLIAVPTAPFREEWVCRALDETLAGIPGLDVAADRFGNRIARLRRGRPTGTTATFVAHLDHPGFVFPEGGARRCERTGHYLASFEGRVQTRFFTDAPVRLFRAPDDPGIPGRIVGTPPETPESENRTVAIDAPPQAEGAVLAMWDVPVCEAHNGHLAARLCDDLVGCATIIEALRRLALSTGDVDVAAIFSRAEEAGFCGVLALLADRQLHPLLPENTVFVSVETSSEVGEIALGSGAIIRVGDRSSTFDAAVADLLWALAAAEGIQVRRALMDRGTCEATPFARHGHRAGALCIPLRNYHNMDFGTGRIGPEMIDLTDAAELSRLIESLALAIGTEDPPPPPVRIDYGQFLSRALEHLKPLPLNAALTSADRS